MSKTRKIGVALAVLAALVVGLVACTSGHNTATQDFKKEQAAQAQDSATLLTAQPVPHFDWSQIRQTLIDLEGAEANTVQTTTFFFAQGLSKPYQVCNSIGFPLAASAELTNPMQVIHDGYPNGGAAIDLPQMDPSGFYKADTAGTYVLCINPDGQAEPEYAEPFVHTVAGPAAWDTKSESIILTGAPSVHFHIKK